MTLKKFFECDSCASVGLVTYAINIEPRKVGWDRGNLYAKGEADSIGKVMMRADLCQACLKRGLDLVFLHKILNKDLEGQEVDWLSPQIWDYAK